MFSFALAIILAGLAVVGTQQFLATERAAISDQFRNAVSPTEEPAEPRNTIVIAREQINFGERISPGKVEEIEWASAVLPEGSYSKIDDLIVGEEDDVARFAVTTMTVGEPVLSNKVTDPGQRAKLSTALSPGKKAISIRVNDVLGVAGFVLPGDRVDVLLTRGRNSKAFVDVLLQGVKVLAIDQIADDRKDQPSVVRTVTFEVDTDEAQKLVLGSNVGTLSLALRNLASTDVQNFERITLSDLNETDAAAELLETERRAKAEAQRQAEAEAARLAAIAAAEAQLKLQQEETLALAAEERLRLQQEAEARQNELEALLKSLSDGISDRLDGVEQSISTPKSATVPKEVVAVQEPIAVPILPRNTTVGVIRNGKRNEYKVKPGELEEDLEVVESVQEGEGTEQTQPIVPLLSVSGDG
ncbi:MAG: Flp pilus assembly protein CpaB [Natronospirillum sp.]